MTRVFSAFFLFICCAYSCFAKEYASINITQKDGLISDDVFDIYQDEEGYMWFATMSGVSKYNGVKFENYTTNNGLADNTCYYFRKDYQGRLWIGSNNGLLQYYKDGIFHSEKNTPFLQLSCKGGIIRDMVVEKDSSITVGFQDPSVFVSIIGNRIKYFDLRKLDIVFSSIIDIVWNNSNSYSIICNHEKIDIDSAVRIIHRSPLPRNIHLSRMVVGRDQEYYLDYDNNYYTKDFQLRGKLPKSISNAYTINRIHIDHSKLYISTSQGLYIDSFFSFKNIKLTTVFKDNEGNFWISSIREGVFKLSKDFQNSYRLNIEANKEVVFAKTSGNKLLLSFNDRNFSIYTNGVRTFHFDCKSSTGLNYEGTKFGNLIYKNIYLNLLGNYPYVVNDVFGPKPMVKIFKKRSESYTVYTTRLDSNILLGNRQGVWLFKYDFSKIYDAAFFEKHFEYYSKDTSPYRVSIPSPQRIHAFDKSYSNNAVWYSTPRSMCKIVQNKTVADTQLSKLNIEKFALLKNYMACITFDNKLLILHNYDTAGFEMDSSIKQDCVWSHFEKVNDSTVLVFTNDFYRLITAFPSNTSLKYTIRIIDNPFIPQQASYFYADSNDCYFFRKNEISKFPLKELFKVFGPPEIHFQKLKTLKNEYRVSPSVSLTFAESREINIKYGYVSLNSSQLDFEYQITSNSSQNNKWAKADGESISLLKIGFGTYIIKLRAKTSSGLSSDIQSFTLIIQKPFWLSWWFISVVIVFLLLAILLIIKSVIKRKNIEKEKEIKFIQSEYRALNALMNPHFIFNSINNVQGLINTDQKQSASEYLRTISDLIRQNMYNISGDFISLEKEFDLIINYLKLEKLRFNDILNYEINIDPTIELDLIKVPPLLIQPLVENAIKYGIWQSGMQGGFIRINVYYDHKFICIDVIDNGNGLKIINNTDIKHQSTALNNIKMRIEQLSKMYNKFFEFSIVELKGKNGEVSGVKASIRMDE